MKGEILKQFLVSLGFGVDDSSLKKFNAAISSAVTRVGLLAAGIKAAGAATFLGIAKISEGFEEIGYQYRIIAPAINKAILLRKAMLSAYKDAGINIVQAVQSSIKFNMTLAKTKFQLEGIVKSTGLKFIPMLTKQMDIFRAKVSANMPKILKMLERFVFFIFKAFDATVTLTARLWGMLQRVYDLLVNLDKLTNGWSTKVIALIAAWKLLNLSFLATPIGMLLTGFLALLALYDDFKTFQEGGESLFDWGNPAIKTILGVVTAAIALLGVVKTAMLAMTAFKGLMIGINVVVTAFKTIMAAIRIAMLVGMLNPVGLIVAAVAGLIALITVLILKWDTIKKSVGDFFSGIGDKALSFIGGGGVNNALKASPLGSSPSNTSQNVKQETNIIVQGNSNPESTAKAVVQQQGRVNFDMARNMKGAVR